MVRLTSAESTMASKVVEAARNSALEALCDGKYR